MVHNIKDGDAKHALLWDTCLFTLFVYLELVIFFSANELLWMKFWISCISLANCHSAYYQLTFFGFWFQLESNLHVRAFSVEWHRRHDSVTTVGSASHIVTNSLRVSSKNGIGRRRASYPDTQSSSLYATTGLGLFWWRGGKISRELFKWKVLPRSLASKAARQGL